MFVNNVVTEQSSMQIGSVEEDTINSDAHGAVDYGEGQGWDEWSWSEEINAIKGNWGWQQGGGWQRPKGKGKKGKIAFAGTRLCSLIKGNYIQDYSI